MDMANWVVRQAVAGGRGAVLMTISDPFLLALKAGPTVLFSRIDPALGNLLDAKVADGAMLTVARCASPWGSWRRGAGRNATGLLGAAPS